MILTLAPIIIQEQIVLQHLLVQALPTIQQIILL